MLEVARCNLAAEARLAILRRRQAEAREAVDALARELRHKEAATVQAGALVTRLEQELACARERAADLGLELAELVRERERAALLRAELARLSEQLAGLARAIEEPATQPVAPFVAEGGEIPAAVLRAFDAKPQQARIARLVPARERLGPVNLRAAQKRAELEQELDAGRAEQQKLRAAIERLRQVLGRIDREALERVLAACAEVDRHFEASFQRLFGGGRARLRLSDLDHPFAAGLELDARPPGKSCSL